MAFEVVVTVQHAACDSATGSIYAYGTGGVPPYTYLWNTGANTPSIFNVLPGTYTITVFDSEGNEAMETVELIQTSALFPPFAPEFPAWSCDDLCNGYYSNYIPLNGAFPYNIVFDPPGPIGNASPNGLYFNSLCPGTDYTVTVTDDNGCTGVLGPLEVVGSMAPELIDSVITGSCPGGATGAILLEFDQLDSLWITGPNGWLALETTNPFYLGNLPAGAYAVTANYVSGSTPPGTSGAYCTTVLNLVVPVTNDPCGSISGVMYADLDGSCTQDANDLGIPYRIIAIEPGGHLTLTNAIGEYATELFYDDYSLDASITNYDVICPSLPTPFTLNTATPSVTIDLAMDPLFAADVSSHLSSGVHRPGFPVTYQGSAINEGPFGFTDLTFDLFFDPLMSFVSASGSPTMIGPGHVQWDIGDLPGYTTLSFIAEFTIPANTGLIGTIVEGSTVVSTEVPDADPGNNVHVITRTIVGAYDPNDKLVRTSSMGSASSYFLDLDEWVEYTVRFQNTGTAEAINVYITDTIAAELDLLSLQILTASHVFGASLLPGRVVRFDFPNIMLPDSGADFSGSQGYASFRLRPVSGLLPGTILSNEADIFFDFNDPIRTNDAELVVELSTAIESVGNGRLQIHPNPVTDVLRVPLDEASWNITVLGMDGRVVKERSHAGGLLTLDLADLASGTYVLRAMDRSARSTIQAPFVKR